MQVQYSPAHSRQWWLAAWHGRLACRRSRSVGCHFIDFDAKRRPMNAALSLFVGIASQDVVHMFLHTGLEFREFVGRIDKTPLYGSFSPYTFSQAEVVCYPVGRRVCRRRVSDRQCLAGHLRAELQETHR